MEIPRCTRDDVLRTRDDVPGTRDDVLGTRDDVLGTRDEMYLGDDVPRELLFSLKGFENEQRHKC